MWMHGTDIQFEAKIEEYNNINKKWAAYVSNDITLQLIMLDPYRITTLNGTNEGIYT